MTPKDGVEGDDAATTANKANADNNKMESWTKLLAEAFVEIAAEEVKAGPRLLGWRRPGFGEPPLSRFHASQAMSKRLATPQSEQKQTWRRVRQRLEEVVKVGGGR